MLTELLIEPGLRALGVEVLLPGSVRMSVSDGVSHRDGDGDVGVLQLMVVPAELLQDVQRVVTRWGDLVPWLILADHSEGEQMVSDAIKAFVQHLRHPRNVRPGLGDDDICIVITLDGLGDRHARLQPAAGPLTAKAFIRSLQVSADDEDRVPADLEGQPGHMP